MTAPPQVSPTSSNGVDVLAVICDPGIALLWAAHEGLESSSLNFADLSCADSHSQHALARIQDSLIASPLLSLHVQTDTASAQC